MYEVKLNDQRQEFIQDRVSAVIPVYNGELHLMPMLDSILDQTYSQVEVILVDDGSTDDTVQIAESYCDKFAAKGYEYYIVQTVHKNASAAINCGLPYVTGEYLIWPDSDDRLEKESIKKRVDFLKSHPQYQCVRSRPYYFEQNTKKILPPDEKMGDMYKEDLFWDVLESKTYICCGCYMLRTQKFFEIYPERYIPEYDVGQNFQMLLPFLYYHLCPTIPEQLYGVCVRQGSHSRTGLSKVEEKKKYNDFENLIDEIASICCIDDKKSKDRIMYWKSRRRYSLAIEHKDIRKIAEALQQMNKYGEQGIYPALKDFLHNLREQWRSKWKRKFQ